MTEVEEEEAAIGSRYEAEKDEYDEVDGLNWQSGYERRHDELDMRGFGRSRCPTKTEQSPQLTRLGYHSNCLSIDDQVA